MSPFDCSFLFFENLVGRKLLSQNLVKWRSWVSRWWLHLCSCSFNPLELTFVSCSYFNTHEITVFWTTLHLYFWKDFDQATSRVTSVVVGNGKNHPMEGEKKGKKKKKKKEKGEKKREKDCIGWLTVDKKFQVVETCSLVSYAKK